MIEYACRVEDPFGNYIKTIRNFIDPSDGGGAGLDYVLNVGKDSACLITLSSREDINIFDIDCRFRPMRSIHGQVFYNDNDACYLLRKKTITQNWFRLSSRHVNGLLDRRIVAYASGSTYADKTDEADNIIKQFARENIGSSISTADRDTGVMSSADLVTSGYLSIDADKSDGEILTRESSRGKMLGILQDIADTSSQDGTYVSFGIIGNGQPFNLTTRTGAWGADRRQGTKDPVILSPNKGNLDNWKLEIDHSEEATVVIAGGDGQKDERITQVVSDPIRIAASPFGHIETFVDAPNCDTDAKTLAYALSVLRQKEAKITFEADLIETAGAIRGKHFDLGDIVTAKVNVQGVPMVFDCRLDTIYVSIRSSGHRTRVQLTSPI